MICQIERPVLVVCGIYRAVESQELLILLPTAASRASVAAFPTTYVVSGVGTVVFMHSGVLIWDDTRVQAFFARFSLRRTGLTGKFVMAFT